MLRNLRVKVGVPRKAIDENYMAAIFSNVFLYCSLHSDLLIGATVAILPQFGPFGAKLIPPPSIFGTNVAPWHENLCVATVAPNRDQWFTM